MTQSIFCVLDKMSTWDRHNLCDFTNQGPNLYIVQLELLIWNQTIFHLFSLGILVYWWLSSVASLSLSLSLSLPPRKKIFDSHLTGTKIFDSQRFARKIAIIYPLFGILFDIIERKRREEYPSFFSMNFKTWNYSIHLVHHATLSHN